MKNKMDTMLLAMHNSEAECKGWPIVSDIKNCDEDGIAYYRMLLEAAMKSVKDLDVTAGNQKPVLLIEPSGEGPSDNPWELYRDLPEFGAATEALENAWKEAELELRSGVYKSEEVDSIIKNVTKVMERYEDVGADDSEPLQILAFRTQKVLREVGYVDAVVDRWGGVVMGHHQVNFDDLPKDTETVGPRI